MMELPFDEDSFDLIWCEGGIYIIGFEKGLTEWKPLLKAGGCVAVTNVTYLKNDIPDELRRFWEPAYPEIATVDKFLEKVERAGYKILNYFVLPEAAWMDEYYTPMETRLKDLRVKYVNNSEALGIIEESQREIDLYRNFSDCYGYVFYVMKSVS
jgi:ubiquinone/menaquinone biosynthesis C-methylase UbiE